MKKTFASLVLVGLFGAAAAGCTVRGSAYATTPTATVEVYEEPPPPRVVHVSQRPGYIWIDGRWDYRVTLVFRSVAAAHDNTGEEAIVRALYPDQETFRREEQRRFEILEAHWDVPLVPVELER